MSFGRVFLDWRNANRWFNMDELALANDGAHNWFLCTIRRVKKTGKCTESSIFNVNALEVGRVTTHRGQGKKIEDSANLDHNAKVEQLPTSRCIMKAPFSFFFCKARKLIGVEA